MQVLFNFILSITFIIILTHILLMDFIIQYILPYMQEQSQIPNQFSLNSTLKLQHALHSYVIKEMDRSILENKVNVLRQQSQTIRKKAKIIQNQISKISEIKKQYKMKKNNISQLIYIEREKMKQKINKHKQRRLCQKENIQNIRQLISKERHMEYRDIKKKEKLNEFNITQNFKRSLYEKRQKSLEARLKQEQSKLNQTIFMEKKRLIMQQQTQLDILPLELGMAMQQKQINQMRELEKQLLKKLECCRQSLSKSKFTLKRVLN